MPAAKVSPSIPSMPSMPSTTPLNHQSIKSIKFIKSMKSSNISKPLNRPLIITDSIDSSDAFVSDITDSDNSIVNYCNLNGNDMKLTPYQRVLRSLESDERWQREITLGRRVGFYRFRGEIGTGNFSQVKVALHCLTREKVAVKILDKSKLDSKTRKMLLREINSMQVLHHPNIISIFEVIETLSKIHIVMEWAPNGELFQYITREGRLEEKFAKSLFAQIVAAIDHMHSHNIIHRDIKAENIFFSDFQTVKVGDFGFSTHIKTKDELLNTFCGSPPYASPELFHDKSYFGPFVDYWALGVLLYFMVTSLMPFKAQTISALKKLIIEGIYEIPDYLSEECRSLIKGLLRTDVNQRLNLNQLKHSEWLKGQTFADSWPQYKLKLFDIESEKDNNNICLTCEERQVYKHLKDLGITNVMIADSLDKGPRSSVGGSFSIIMNRIIKSELKKSNSIETDKNENIIVNESDFKNNNHIIRSKSSKSITKSIKSVKNIFSDKTTIFQSKVGQSSSLETETNLSKTMKKSRKFKKSKTCCLL